MSVAEPRAAALPDACAGSAHRHDGATPGGTPRHTPRHKKYCRDRIGRRCSPTRCSPGSYTAGSSPPALATHAPTGLDSAVLRGDKYRAEDSPHRHRTAGGPGVFDRVPGPSLLGRGLKLKWECLSAAGPQNPRKENGCRSFRRRWRQTALRLRRRRRQQTEDDQKPITAEPVVKPRLSPESRGFRSPSTDMPLFMRSRATSVLRSGPR
jgi:hypothetical protein